MNGAKHDSGKLRYDLVPPFAEEAVVAVLSYGAKKYAPDNWRKVPEPMARYLAAARRHLAAWQKGECLDAESGLPHLAHAACCLLFLLELDGSVPLEPREIVSDVGRSQKADAPKVTLPPLGLLYDFLTEWRALRAATEPSALENSGMAGFRAEEHARARFDLIAQALGEHLDRADKERGA